jgi:hypothetical protein
MGAVLRREGRDNVGMGSLVKHRGQDSRFR